MFFIDSCFLFINFFFKLSLWYEIIISYLLKIIKIINILKKKCCKINNKCCIMFDYKRDYSEI